MKVSGQLEPRRSRQNGARLVSGGGDKTVRVTWIGRTKQELIETARARLPRELTEERRRFHLVAE